MIFKSIRWRLQLWYGLILVVVLMGFGFTAYQLQRNRQFRRIDGELQRRFAVLANVLRAPPRRPDRNRPPEPPPLDQPPEARLRADALRRPGRFHLPPRTAALFDTNETTGFYFEILSRDNTPIARGGSLPARPPRRFVPPHRHVREPASNPPRPPAATSRLNLREIIQTLPSGNTIIVGRSIAPELKELRLTALRLAGAGGIILLFGLAGGWWLAGRAIRPIHDISATAAKISAGDLSQRINVAEAESELGRLAAVLNSTFARLETAFAQQRQFVSDAAHELRTPVSVILTQTQSALQRDRSTAEYRESLDACQRTAQRMRRLIGALLDLARMDAGQEPLKRMRFNLQQIICDCIEPLRPLADERSVKISSQLAPTEITGDPERLAQVVTNLLVNAIQYNKPGGEARLKLQSQNGMAVLTLTDTGPGIAAEDLPHVFKRFYRADKSRSSGNAGLGLPIAKAIVEAHGGTLEASSTTGTGTTLTVRLPVA